MSKPDNKHPILGYDLNAPLPYMLTNEDILGKKYQANPDEYTEDLGSTYAFLPDAEALAEFLNQSSLTNTLGEIPEMDENVFVKSFLPHFYNESSADKLVLGGVEGGVAVNWQRCVAGSVYTPVNITRAGQVIYRVPPLLGRLNVVGSKDRDKSIAVAYKEMENTLRVVPHAFEPQLKHLLDNAWNSRDGRHESDLKTKLNLKYLFVLDEIFTYYGYDSILTPEIMSIKPLVFGVKHGNTSQPGRPVSTPTTNNMAPVPIEDDDDLF